MLTDQEKLIINMLGEVWNEFLKLPEQHPQEKSEFVTDIHKCQSKVLARLGQREINK